MGGGGSEIELRNSEISLRAKVSKRLWMNPTLCQNGHKGVASLPLQIPIFGNMV